MTPHKDKLLAALEEQAKAKREYRLKAFKAYPKQQLFFDAGLTKRERMLNAGTQQGKTYAGAVEMAYHLTGDYPADWKGRRWDQPIIAWACGVSAEVVRDVQQARLCGQPGIEDALGTGLIPKDRIVGQPSRSHGIADAYDTIHVRHKSGGISSLTFKCYTQGKTKFVGSGVDLIWMDEEPGGPDTPDGMQIYMEALSRTNATRGSIYTTYTPIFGVTDLWERFDQPSPDRERITMTIRDAEHFSEEDKKRIIASYAPHERETRVNGVPYMGSGRIFAFPEEQISEEPFVIPDHYALLWAIDPGVTHPFAAVLLAWDRDTDVIHIVHTVRMSDATSMQHAYAMRSYDQKWGEQIPVSWPGDTNQRKEFEGDLLPLTKIYRTHGLKMLSSPATFPDGSNSTEAGLMLMTDRFISKKLRVFRTCSEWFEEYRQYHRSQGKIHKVRDDLMSATRVGVMTIRYAVPVRLRNRRDGRSNIALNAELSGDDLF